MIAFCECIVSEGVVRVDIREGMNHLVRPQLFSSFFLQLVPGGGGALSFSPIIQGLELED